MKAKEMINYLSQFSPNAEMSIVLLSRKNDVIYPSRDVISITDLDAPCIMIDIDTDTTEPLRGACNGQED